MQQRTQELGRLLEKAPGARAARQRQTQTYRERDRDKTERQRQRDSTTFNCSTGETLTGREGMNHAAKNARARKATRESTLEPEPRDRDRQRHTERERDRDRQRQRDSTTFNCSTGETLREGRDESCSKERKS